MTSDSYVHSHIVMADCPQVHGFDEVSQALEANLACFKDEVTPLVSASDAETGFSTLSDSVSTESAPE